MEGDLIVGESVTFLSCCNVRRGKGLGEKRKGHLTGFLERNLERENVTVFWEVKSEGKTANIEYRTGNCRTRKSDSGGEKVGGETGLIFGQGRSKPSPGTSCHPPPPFDEAQGNRGGAKKKQHSHPAAKAAHLTHGEGVKKRRIFEKKLLSLTKCWDEG